MIPSESSPPFVFERHRFVSHDASLAIKIRADQAQEYVSVRGRQAKVYCGLCQRDPIIMCAGIPSQTTTERILRRRGHHEATSILFGRNRAKTEQS